MSDQLCLDDPNVNQIGILEDVRVADHTKRPR